MRINKKYQQIKKCEKSILEGIIFYCVIYALSIYHHSERVIPYFTCPDSCCDLGRVINFCFQALGKMIMHIFLFEEVHTPICFGKACVICSCPKIILVLCELKLEMFCLYMDVLR